MQTTQVIVGPGVRVVSPPSPPPPPPHVALIANWKAGLFHRAILQPTR